MVMNVFKKFLSLFVLIDIVLKKFVAFSVGQPGSSSFTSSRFLSSLLAFFKRGHVVLQLGGYGVLLAPTALLVT